MKASLISKIKKYSVLTSSVLGGATALGQGGIYTPVQDTLNGDQLFTSIDLDQDGIPDIKIEYRFYDDDLELYGFECDNLNEDIELLGAVPNSYNYPLKLELGSLINENAEWLEAGEGGSMGWFNNGFPYFSYWNGTVDSAFLGLRIEKNQSYHYGWVRLSVNSNNSQIIVHDAYLNSFGNRSINAGDGSPIASVSPIVNPDFVAVNQKENSLQLISKNGSIIENIQLFDITGQQIIQANHQKAQYDMNTLYLERGLYLFVLKINGRSHTIKWVKP